MAELIINVSLNNQATAGLKEIDKKLAEIGGKETKVKVGVDTTGVTQGAKTVNNALSQTEGTIGKISISLANMLKIKAFQAITSEIQSSLKEMKAVDDELVTVRKVANATDAELKSLNDRAYNVGSQYGMKASDYLSTVADFTRAGYKELAGDLGELAIKTQLVGDVSQNVATQMLLSVDTAYQYQGSVEKLSAVLDGMNEIDNNFATSIGKISTGLGKVAPIAAQAHVGVDELSAAIGTITAVTQRSGEEAATALRALFLNIIGDTKTEIADGATWTAGEIEGLHDVLVKYAPAAVEAAKATGEVVNPMEAIGGLAQSMKDGLLTEQELMSMVSDIGGKLRTSQLLAIIQNWDMYKDMLTSFGAAAGSADKEVSNAMDSWTRKSEILSNSVTKLMNDLLDTKVIKGGLDFLTGIVDTLDTAGGKAILQGAAVTTGLTAISKAIDMISKSLNGLKGLATFGWIGAAISAISLLAAGINELFPGISKLTERSATAQQNYEAEKTKLEEINNELETTADRIDELESKGSITLVEQAELDRLKEATQELLLQQSIQEWRTESAQKEAALAQAKVVDKYEYADPESVAKYVQNLKAYLSEMKESGGDFELVDSLIDNSLTRTDHQIGQLAADYQVLNEYAQYYTELAQKAADAGDYDYAEMYQGFASRLREASDTTEARLKEQIGTISDAKTAMKDYYESLVKAHSDAEGKLDYSTLTQTQKDFVESFQKGDWTIDHLQKLLGVYFQVIDEQEALQDNASKKIDPDVETGGVDALTQSLRDALAAQDALEKKLKEMGESGDAYRGYADYFKQFDELYKNGETGTYRFAEIFNLIANDSVKAQVGRNAKAAAEWFNGELQTELREAAEKGGVEFVKYLYNKGFEGTKNAIFKNGKNYAVDYDLIDYEKWSEETGYAEKTLMSFFGAADEGNKVMKDVSGSTDDAANSFENLADSVSRTENGVKKVRFSDYVKEAAKAGKSVKEIQADISELGKADSGFKLEIDVDKDKLDDAIEEAVADAQGTEETYTTTFDGNTEPLKQKKEEAVAEGEDFASKTFTASLTFRVGSIAGALGGLTGLLGTGLASGTDDAPGGPTLVNELGPELIAQDGRAFVAGGGKPTVVNLKKGAIVYNHLETEAMLKGQSVGEEGIASRAKGSAKGKVTDKLGKTSTTGSWLPPGIDALFSDDDEKKPPSGGGGSKGGGSSAASAEKEDEPGWWKIVEDYYKRAVDEANRAIDRLDYRLELIKNDWDDLKEPLDKEIDALDRVNDQLDRQATLLERERDKTTKPLNDQIDAMEKAKGIQDEQLELAEKQKAVEEARNELQNAQNERTIRYFNTQKGQWEWMADKGRVKDAQDALADAEKDLADFQYDMQIKALERQVDEIEDAYQKQLDAIEEKQTANDDRIYELERQLQALEDYYEAAMEPLEKKQKELERKLAAIEEQWAEAEMPYTKPEGNLSEALGKIGGTSSENQAVRDIVSKAQGNGSSSLDQTKASETLAPFTIAAAKAIQDAMYQEYGIQFGSAGSSSGSTQPSSQAQNNIVNNSGTTLIVNGMTISGDFKTMTISDLISDLGIYAGQ